MLAGGRRSETEPAQTYQRGGDSWPCFVLQNFWGSSTLIGYRADAEVQGRGHLPVAPEYILLKVRRFTCVSKSFCLWHCSRFRANGDNFTNNILKVLSLRKKSAFYGSLPGNFNANNFFKANVTSIWSATPADKSF
jgi:hypothetical protein